MGENSKHNPHRRHKPVCFPRLLNRSLRPSVLLLAIAVLITCAPASGQQLIHGTIIDADTGQPLSLSHILLEGTTQGTTANREGRFMLRVGDLPASLIIRHLGYKAVRVSVTRHNQHIQVALRPAVISMERIDVPANYAELLVQQAFEQARQERGDFYSGNAFYRQLTRSDSVYTEWLEIFFTTYNSNNHITLSRVDHGRYAVRPDTFENNYIHTRDFSTFLYEFSLTQRARPIWQQYLFPLRPRSDRHFHFDLVDRLMEEDRSIARIRYQPQQSVRMPAFDGWLYIDEDDYRVRRFTARIRHDAYVPLEIRGGRSRIAGPIEMRYDVSYRRHPEGRMVVDYIQIDALYTQVRRREFERSIHTQALLLYYDHDFGPRPRRLRRPSNRWSDYRIIDGTRYDPDFWVDNPVLLDTPVEQEVIRSFEKSGAFGRIFNE